MAEELIIRLVAETDVPKIAALYQEVYGENYPFREFYDTEWIKRGIYDKNIRWYIAADPSGRLLGSAAVMIHVGDGDDLVSEIGRLVVHSDARGCNLGSRLVREVVAVAGSIQPLLLRGISHHPFGCRSGSVLRRTQPPAATPTQRLRPGPSGQRPPRA